MTDIEEAKDVSQAFADYRIIHSNNEAQLLVALAKTNRQLTELQARLNTPGKAESNVIDIQPETAAA